MLTLLSKGGGVAVFSKHGGLSCFYFFGLASQNWSMLTSLVSASTDACAEGHLKGHASKPRSGLLPASPSMLMYFWREKGFADRNDLMLGRLLLPTF